MERGIALVIRGIDVGVQVLEEVFHGGHHARRRKAMRVRRETFTIAGAGRGHERRHTGSADRHGRSRRHVFDVALDVGGARASRALHRRDVRIGAVGGQQFHRVDVARVRGAPERRGADLVNA